MFGRNKPQPTASGFSEPTFRGEEGATLPEVKFGGGAEADHAGRADDTPKSTLAAPAQEKPVKVKKVKPPKAAKAPKGLPVEEDFSIPTMVLFDFCQGMTKMTDAEAHARALVEDFTSKSSSWIYCMSWRGGMAVEVQQGGGRAFLPEVLAAFEENEGAIVAVPMSNRVAQVTLNEAGMMETMLLSTEQGPPENALPVMPGPQMKPYDLKGGRIAALGTACAVLSIAAAGFAMFGFFADKESWAAPYLEQTSLEALPIGEAAQRELARAAGAGECVLKIEFMDGAWRATNGFSAEGQCVKDRPAVPVGGEGASGVVDGAAGAVPADAVAPGGAAGSAMPVGTAPAAAPAAPVVGGVQ